MTPLYAELNRWHAIEHQWGIADCITLLADWVLRCTGIDPAEDVRLTYRSAGEAQRVWRFYSDPLRVVAPRLERCGLSRTDDHVAGDVGVVMIEDCAGTMPHGAICLGGQSWATKSVDCSVMRYEAPVVLAAWGVGYAA